jgi:hypothetical protein
LSGRPASKIHGWRGGQLHVERMLWPDAPRNAPRENPEPE